MDHATTDFATSPPPAKTRPPADIHAPMAPLAARLAAEGWQVQPWVSCLGEAMLMIETAACGGAAATWLVSTVAGPSLRLDRLVDDAWLQLECEGPPDRILVRLGAHAPQPAPQPAQHAAA